VWNAEKVVWNVEKVVWNVGKAVWNVDECTVGVGLLGIYEVEVINGMCGHGLIHDHMKR
jgi:hypothetical protein